MALGRRGTDGGRAPVEIRVITSGLSLAPRMGGVNGAAEQCERAARRALSAGGSVATRRTRPPSRGTRVVPLAHLETAALRGIVAATGRRRGLAIVV
jgi:hypothetical protein